MPWWTSRMIGASTARYGFHFSISSNVRPGSLLCSSTAKRVSPEATIASRRTLSNVRGLGCGAGEEDAHPPTGNIARTTRTAKAFFMPGVYESGLRLGRRTELLELLARG